MYVAFKVQAASACIAETELGVCPVRWSATDLQVALPVRKRINSRD